jgi:hypothetical protein
MGSKGAIGELLIILVLLASTALIVTTFVNREDVPNIAKASLTQFRDMRSIISVAVLQWLDNGVSTEPMACNGVYPVSLSSDSYVQTLEPYIQEAVTEAKEDELTAGELKDIEFTDDGKLVVKLQNGTITYQDDLIYAQDKYDKEYEFNVRLLLALRVAQDWLRCDAGNLSDNLAAEYGTQCFFGVKDPGYPGFCADKNYRITENDRNYMMSKAITPATLARATQGSVDTLNKYFAGEQYCKQQLVQGDTGISCRYELEDMDFEYKMFPYRHERIVLPFEDDAMMDAGIIRTAIDAGDEDYRYFMSSDRHVWALPARIVSAPYVDEQMSTSSFDCDVPGREAVPTKYQNNEPFERSGMVSVRSGTSTVEGKPILYVNTTRGSKFTVKVTCTDSRAALLGRPLEYTFRFRTGLRQSCGPNSWLIGTYDCGRCLPKPANDLDKCSTATAPCGDVAYTLCRDSLIWKYRWQDHIDLPGATPLEVLQGMRTTHPELLDQINGSCGGIIGMPDYPLIKDPSGACKGVEALAGSVVCCGMFGFKEQCADTHNINNADCFYSVVDGNTLCRAQKSCGKTECGELLCDPGTGDCLLNQQSIKVGQLCRNGCESCDAKGECKPTPARADQTCQGGWADSCIDWKCDAQGSNCIQTVKPGVTQGQSCNTGYRESECAPNQCIPFNDHLACLPNMHADPSTDGRSCEGGSNTYTNSAGEQCTVQMQCKSGFCSEVEATRECKPNPDNGGGCKEGCQTSDGCQHGTPSCP